MCSSVFACDQGKSALIVDRFMAATDNFEYRAGSGFFVRQIPACPLVFNPILRGRSLPLPRAALKLD
jgi:hypothetical protein